MLRGKIKKYIYKKKAVCAFKQITVEEIMTEYKTTMRKMIELEKNPGDFKNLFRLNGHLEILEWLLKGR